MSEMKLLSAFQLAPQKFTFSLNCCFQEQNSSSLV